MVMKVQGWMDTVLLPVTRNQVIGIFREKSERRRESKETEKKC